MLKGAQKPSHPMNPPAPSFSRRLSIRLARARFFTFSALLHLAIVIMGGSVVLIKNLAEPPDFAAGADSGIFSSEPETAQPPTAPVNPTPEFAPPTPQTAAPSATTITTTSPTAIFFQPASISTWSPDGKLGAVTKLPGSGSDDAAKQAIAGAMRTGGTAFGRREKSPSALVGTFYDLKQTRNRKPTGLSPDDYHQTFRRFVHENWRESILSDYFKAPQPLYATQIMIPNMPADEGPKAFGMEKEVQPSRWLVHYKARVTPPADGTYRFVGAGDDVMIVRFNGKVVLDRCWYQQDQEWQPDKNYDYGWTAIPNGFARGDAIRVRAGQSYDLEVLLGEQPGGLVFACLMMEKEGETYERDARGNPILPPFRVADAAMPALENGQTLPPFAADGPVWKAAPVRAGGGSMFEDFFGKK